jgi:DNA-binding SARP family transcriptional activator
MSDDASEPTTRATSFPGWRLRLLGGFDLRFNDGVVELTVPSQQLVALLALRQVNRNSTAQLLWPDADRVRAHARLRTTMWRLNKACPGILNTAGTTMRLSSWLSVDVHDLAAGRAAGTAGERTHTFDARAGGELLPGWDEDWIIEGRERCRQLYLHRLEEAGRRLLRRDDYAAAMDTALSLVSASPLRDSAHRLVIEIHLAEGNLDEAFRAYRRYCRVLREELGLAPSPKLHDLLVAHGVPLTGARSSRMGFPATR